MTTGAARSVLCQPQPGDFVGAGTSCTLAKLSHEQTNIAATLVPR